MILPDKNIDLRYSLIGFGSLILPELKTMQTVSSLWEKMREQGWHEDPRLGKTDPRIKKMWDYLGFPELTDDDSWCACAMNCCLKLAGYKTSDKIPVARSFETYGVQVPFSNIVKGDLVVFERGTWQGHVGFYDCHANEGSLNILGGNQDNMVGYKRYPITSTQIRLRGVRRLTKTSIISEPDIKTLKEWGLL